jgi:hypothetical protein
MIIELSPLGPLREVILPSLLKCTVTENCWVMVMVFNATFNNISVILWWSVLLVEETRVPRENRRPVASH